MSSKRIANRFRLVVLVSLAATLALGSFWMLEVLRRSMPLPVTHAAPDEPDYYVEQFSFSKLIPDRKLRYDMSGERLLHFPGPDLIRISKPVLRSISLERPPLSAQAEQALVSDNNSKIEMIDNVRIDRPASATSEALSLRSEEVTLLPDDDIMQTDRPAEISLGKATLSGTGLFVNNATREMRFSGKVRGTYPAP